MTVNGLVIPDDALRHCRDVTRRRARNFYYGLKLLPEPRRSAMFAIYAWMREADDIADAEDVDPPAARARLEAFRSATREALEGGADPRDPLMVALCAAARHWPLERAPFDAMLDGQLDDLDGRTYDTFHDLRTYCERVASSVGLVCITVWGYDDERAPRLAVDRGIALQLTNILRDFAEDFDQGRIYLPAEDFHRHGLDATRLRDWVDPDRCRRFLDEQIERASSFYTSSRALESMIAPDCRATLWAMTEIYHGLLVRMRANPRQIVAGPRVRLGALNKGTIAITARWRSRMAAAR